MTLSRALHGIPPHAPQKEDCFQPGTNDFPPLRVHRQLKEGEPGISDESSSAVLGCLSYGATTGVDLGHTLHLPCEGRLLSEVAGLDIWRTSGPFTQGQQGSVRWCHNGHWLFGVLSCAPANQGQTLGDLTQQAYQAIFQTLSQTACPHLLRVWNYIPQIHDLEQGLERYRGFNSGRQAAFLQAQQAAFEGAPVACALGVAPGVLRIGFLAGRSAALAIENPRQVSAYHYPADYGPHSPTFSRAALLPVGDGQVALLISGTSSIVGHQSRHVGDVTAQTRETLVNLQAVINAARPHTNARFELAQADCTIYVRRLEDFAVVRECFAQTVGTSSYAAQQAVVVQADVCRADLSVEIEAQVWATGEIV
jgi:chorismate lyase / 3-hydroxybenzoate synthase